MYLEVLFCRPLLLSVSEAQLERYNFLEQLFITKKDFENFQQILMVTILKCFDCR